MDNKSVRQWQEIAAELINEFDPNRVVKLSAELNEALVEDLKKPVLERQEETARVASNPLQCHTSHIDV